MQARIERFKGHKVFALATDVDAAGLVLLNKLLFGGMGRHCFGMNALRRSGPTFPTWKERAAMRDRIRAMGKEERREYIRRQMFGCGPDQPEKTDHDSR